MQHISKIINKEYIENLLKKTDPQVLMDKGICPDCLGTKTRERYEQNGPDDYDRVFYCFNCGTTAG